MQQDRRGQSRRRTFDVRIVKQEARGLWEGVLSALAPGLQPALQKVGRHVPCPVHGGKDGFRVFKNVKETGGGICNTCGGFDDGMALLQWYNEWSFPETVEAVGNYLGLDRDQQGLPSNIKKRAISDAPVETEAEKRKREYKDRKVREELSRVWKEAYPLTAPESEPARLYFARRGLRLKHALSFTALKLHPSLGYFHEGERHGEFPCLLAMVYDGQGQPVTIHRTYLTIEGFKAPVPSAKKLMPYPSDRTMSGGGIPLMDINRFIGNYDADGVKATVMGVTEGLETALAVIEATEGKMPVWPLINAQLVKGFNVPGCVDVMCIYGDQDKSEAGKEAAVGLKENCQENKIKVFGYIPQKQLLEQYGKSVDWLDIHNDMGPESLPKPDGLIM